MRRRLNPPANVNELRQALIQEWNNIPQAEINTLFNSIRRRCIAVVNSRPVIPVITWGFLFFF